MKKKQDYRRLVHILLCVFVFLITFLTLGFLFIGNVGLLRALSVTPDPSCYIIPTITDLLVVKYIYWEVVFIVLSAGYGVLILAKVSTRVIVLTAFIIFILLFTFNILYGLALIIPFVPMSPAL